MAVNEVIYGDKTLINLKEDTVNEDNLLEGVKAHNAAGEEIVGKVVVANVIDNLESESSDDALSAKQGKELNTSKLNTTMENIDEDGIQKIKDIVEDQVIGNIPMYDEPEEEVEDTKLVADMLGKYSEQDIDVMEQDIDDLKKGGGSGQGIQEVEYEEWKDYPEEKKNKGAYAVKHYPTGMSVGEVNDKVNELSGQLSDISEEVEDMELYDEYELITLPFTAPKTGEFYFSASTASAGNWYLSLKVTTKTGKERNFQFSGNTTYAVTHSIMLKKGDTISFISKGGGINPPSYNFR